MPAVPSAAEPQAPGSRLPLPSEFLLRWTWACCSPLVLLALHGEVFVVITSRGCLSVPETVGCEEGAGTGPRAHLHPAWRTGLSGDDAPVTSERPHKDSDWI